MTDQGLSRRIADYRELAGLSQSELAEAIGIDRSALAKIETGARRVSAVELSNLASALNVRMDWFFTPASDAVVAYRESAPGQVLASIDAWIERLSRASEFVAGLRQLDNPRLSQLDALRNGRQFDAEKAAGQVRGQMGNPGDPIRSMSEAAERVGVWLFAVELGHDSPDGASAPMDLLGIAVVNSSRDVGRRRLAAAHELGHLLAGDQYKVDWRIEAADADAREAALDRFARALLLPKAPITADWRNWSNSGERAAALRVASHWQVDMSTLARRLLELKLIDEAAASRIRGHRAGRADFVELGLVNRTDLEGVALPPSYEKEVLAVYRQDKVSADRAVELLLDTYQDADLPEPKPLPENAIWQLL